MLPNTKLPPQFFRVIFATYHEDDRFATFWDSKDIPGNATLLGRDRFQLFWVVGDGTIATWYKYIYIYALFLLGTFEQVSL